MSEEFLGGNQTTGEQQIETNQQQETQTQEQTPATTQESNYFEIKYNKEPVRVSYGEAPDYIQKGMNYDKVQQRATEYEQHLNRVAQLSGYQNHDDFIQALEEAEKQQERQRYEDAGIDPDTFNQLLENHPDMQYAREMRAKEQEQRQLQSEVEQLREQFPNLTPDDLSDELFTIKEQRGVPLLHAYLELNYSKLAQQKEQEAIQKLQTNAISTPGALGSGGETRPISVKDMSKSDFESMIQRVKRGERVDL